MDEELVKRIPPHSLEAEQSVIGSMLYEPDVIPTALEYINGDDFYQYQYGVIFDTIAELYQANRGTDIVTLQNALKTKDIPPEAYSLETLKELLNSVFTSANIRSYAEIVREKSQLRKMIKTFETLTNQYYAGKTETETLMETTEQQVFNLLEKRGNNKIEPIDQVVLHAVEKIEEAQKAGGGITGLETGFVDLDNMLLGLHNSEFILIAGRPSMGKTAFALNIAEHFAVKKQYVTAFFELEMPREQLATRMIAMESAVDSQNLRSGKLTDANWDDIIAASSKIARSKLIIDDPSGLTISELRTRCRRYKLEYGIQAVIVDYMQLMSGSERAAREGRQNEMADISRQLKSMARELNVPVIALSQLSRGPENRTSDHRPVMSDLRDSGQIEQDADVIMFIYRDEVYNKDTEKKGIAEIIIAKQRNGPTGTVELAWIDRLTKFSNLERMTPNQNT